MAEKLPHIPHESEGRSPEADQAAAELSRKNIERIKQLAEQEKGLDEKSVETLRETVESAAISSEQIPVETQENKPHRDYDQGTLRRNSFNKTMKKVQANLPFVERTFSKVVHQKTIEKVSDISSKTLARPSGVLGAGLFASVGSFIALYFAKHYGFEYNYTIFIFLFSIGFGVGLFLELLIKTARKS